MRVSRLVRETLSFSKKLENHIGAIWYFIHHYSNPKSVVNSALVSPPNPQPWGDKTLSPQNWGLGAIHIS